MSALRSAIYEGRVRHRRHAPRTHAFSYRMAQLYLDLDELDQVFRDRWLWSRDRRNVAEFRRSDFLGDPRRPLAEAVRDRVEAATATRPAGSVCLLAHLRYAGHIFNPVSFYYCHDAGGALHSIPNTSFRVDVYFDATCDASAPTRATAGIWLGRSFVLTNAGLMAGISFQGTRFSRLPL